tara:strand:- start:187 stop:354 length:168 start_codon:yes stop_codon:yes gene_type:complete
VKSKIPTNKELLSKCIGLFQAYMSGCECLENLDTNAQNLIKDIEIKYPDIVEDKL